MNVINTEINKIAFSKYIFSNFDIENHIILLLTHLSQLSVKYSHFIVPDMLQLDGSVEMVSYLGDY